MSAEQITETLEQLVDKLHPELIVKDPDSDVWCVEFEDDSHVVVGYVEDQQKLICSTSFPADVATDDASVDLHEWLLMLAYDGAISGEVGFGLDEEGIVIFQDLPLANLSAKSLEQAVVAIRSAESFWKETLIDANVPTQPPTDSGGMMRV